MEDNVNQSGHLPDVTAQTITKETDVTHVLMVTMVIHVVTQLIFFHGFW